MDADELKQSLSNDRPNDDLTIPLKALWWDAKGDWEKAHDLAQDQDDKAGAWVHAHLHRKEGDLANADYWYEKAARTRPVASLGEEWMAIVRALLALSAT